MTAEPRSVRMRVLAAVAGALAGILAIAAAAQESERAPVFRASSVLPAELRGGTDWTVDETVTNDGFVNHYTVRAGEATLAVDSTDLLRIRAHELEMLAKMEETKRSTLYLDAVKKAATSPLQFAKDLVETPGGTLRGAAGGAGQFFGNIGHSLFGRPSQQEEGVAKAALGVGVAKRKLAEKFTVDPYSSNEPMQSRLGELAWAVTAGNMSVGAGFGAAGGAASSVLRGTKFAGGVGKLIYDKSPDQLKDLNRDKLTGMGMPKELIRAFLDHPKYSPTRETTIVIAIERMSAVGNRRLLIQDAATAVTEPDTFLWQRQIEMIAAYNANVAPVARLVDAGIRPAMVTRKGALVIALPGDYFAWTETLERAVQANRNRPEMKSSSFKSKEFWFAGKVSPFARAKIESRGWVVNDEVGEKLRLP
jgi:hypothetical protein